MSDEDVADLGRTGDDLVAEGVDGPTRQMGARAVHHSGRLAHRNDIGHLRNLDPGRCQVLLVPFPHE